MEFKNQEKVMIYLGILVLSFIIMLMGLTMNSVVIKENGCKMPVLSRYIYETETHFSYLDHSNIKHYYLSDIFKIGKGIWGIGDFFLIGGFGLFVISVFMIIKNIKFTKIENE